MSRSIRTDYDALRNRGIERDLAFTTRHDTYEQLNTTETVLNDE